MNDIEQINRDLLNLIQDVTKFKELSLMKEQYLNGRFVSPNTLSFEEVEDYIQKNQSEIHEKELEMERMSKALHKSRIFNYQQLGDIIAHILYYVEGRPFYSATRLVKHNFQVDESERPFYRLVSFVTDKKDDLKTLLLDHLSASMIVYYMSDSPIIKPLGDEIDSIENYEGLIELEMKNRGIEQIYVTTSHTLPEELELEKFDNTTSISMLPFSYMNDIIERIIVSRYKRDGEPALDDEIARSIGQYFINKNSKKM